MKIKSTKFTGLKIIQSKNYRDSRGFFKEDFKKKFFKDKKFVFGCTSSSKKMWYGVYIYKLNFHKENTFLF